MLLPGETEIRYKREKLGEQVKMLLNKIYMI